MATRESTGSVPSGGYWVEFEKQKPENGARCVVVTGGGGRKTRGCVTADFATAVVSGEREILPARFVLDSGEYVTDVKFWAPVSAAPEGA